MFRFIMLPISLLLGACTSALSTDATKTDQSLASTENARGGKIIVARPGNVCRAAGGQFNSSFPAPDYGEKFIYQITSVRLDTKLVKTGDQLIVKLISNRKVMKRSALEKRTTEMVATDSNGFAYIPLFSTETIQVIVMPGESLSIQDPAMRNFGRKACVKLRPERLPS
ncbi:MAG: hypothetical protein Tsb002_36330 [Wenzhouxiangellaceae bacterium]